MSKESREMANQLRKEGYTVEIGRGSGHYNVERNGIFITSFSASPGTRRFREHVRMALRRRERQILEENLAKQQ
jgi:hypothetical protein